MVYPLTRFRRLLPALAALVVTAVLTWSDAAADNIVAPARSERPATLAAGREALAERGRWLARTGSDRWHAAGLRGKGVKVAVLDSGFRGYKEHLGKALPQKVAVRCFRRDGNFEARNSQHGILCGEVVHTLAPDADLIFANWEADAPETFLDAVRWVRQQGARIITCSIIMPAWSDGEGGGSIHAKLRELLGTGDKPGDPLFFSCAGNTAKRHWSGSFRGEAGGFHQWEKGVIDNAMSPYAEPGERVSVDVSWSGDAVYEVQVLDTTTGKVVARSAGAEPGCRSCAVARIHPESGHSYAARVRHVSGKPGTFHVIALGSGLDHTASRGSIPFPGDGPEVVTVGAVNAQGQRASYSSCGPNSSRPKPDLVASVPVPSAWRSKTFAGTSAASPQAAGLAAVLLGDHRDWNAGQLRAAMQASARRLSPAAHDFETGYGLAQLPELAARKVAANPTGK